MHMHELKMQTVLRYYKCSTWYIPNTVYASITCTADTHIALIRQHTSGLDECLFVYRSTACVTRSSLLMRYTLTTIKLQATLDQMRERGLQVSNISFTTVMKSLVNQNRVDDATQLLADMHSLKVCIYTYTCKHSHKHC
jgi:pentatricopeptide repeat protein